MYIFSMILPLAITVGVVWVIGYGIRSSIHRAKKGRTGEGSKINNNEVISASLFLLGGVLVGMFLFTFNAKLQNPLEPLTVLLLGGLLSLAIAAYFRQLALSVCSILTLFIWIQIKAGLWVTATGSAQINTLAVMMLAGVLLAGVGLILSQLQNYRRLGLTLAVIGIAPILFLLFVASTKSGLRAFEGVLVGKSLLNSTQTLVTVIVLTVAAAIASGWNIVKPANRVNGAILLASVFISIVLLLVPAHSLFVQVSGSSSYMSSADLTSAGILWAFFFNIVLVAILVWFIYAGFRRGNTGQVNAGIALLFVLAVIKYFEWLASFMERSVFFIVTGVVFILIGWLMERGRRYLVSRIKEQGTVSIPQP